MRFPSLSSKSALKSICKSTLSLACLMSLLCGTAEATEVSAGITSTSTDTASTRPLKIAVVNFRKVVEASKQGKQHQGSFEGMKNQMETLLQQKEKTLTELQTKLNDSDYMDGLTKDAENELKHKFRSLTQEYAQAQQQFMQTLQQANMKVIEMMNADVVKAATELARAKGFDLVMNEESLFFYSPTTDISDLIVVEMNKAFDIEQKKRDEAAKNNKPVDSKVK